jgi:hypothetical protein
MRPTGALAIFQATLWLWFIALTAWASIGRFFLGAGGWYGIIMLFTVLPLGVLYGVVISIAAYQRRTRYGQVIPRWTAVSLITSLVALAVVGFTLVDGGDAPDSYGSVLTVALHVDPEGPIGNASMMVAYGSILIAAVGMLAALVLVFAEKPPKPTALVRR